MPNPIAASDYMILVARAAQKKAGARNPSKQEVDEAITSVRRRLADSELSPPVDYSEVDRKDDSGSAWGSIKDAASRTFGVAKKAAPYALPILIPAGVATPFMLAAMNAAKQARKSEQSAKSVSRPPIEEQSSPEKTIEQVEGCGSSEADCIGRFGKSESGMAIPHDAYRAAIWRKAHRLARGRHPGPRHLMEAQRKVDNELGRRGARILIPGAAPGRVTR